MTNEHEIKEYAEHRYGVYNDLMAKNLQERGPLLTADMAKLTTTQAHHILNDTNSDYLEWLGGQD